MNRTQQARYEARAKVIKALAHPARLMIVDELAEHGERCVCELTELVVTTGLTAQLRSIKDKLEIDKIRNAVRTCERAFGVIRSQLTADQTEKQIAHNLEHEIRRFGGSECSFDPIVGVGPRSALPHAVQFLSQRID